jgi:hypothetical protein
VKFFFLVVVVCGFGVDFFWFCLGMGGVVCLFGFCGVGWGGYGMIDVVMYCFLNEI